GGLGLSFILYRFLPIYISLLLIVPVESLSLALAFYRINNKPFIDFLESAFLFYTKERLYIWKKEEKPVIEQNKNFDPKGVYVPKLSESKLNNLSWSLDISKDKN
ncbi:MAG TPA: hypothetical protein VGC58_01945, partial [Candidatus Paceibacterota bacterium]